MSKATDAAHRALVIYRNYPPHIQAREQSKMLRELAEAVIAKDKPDPGKLLLSYALSCRRVNTAIWMDGLAEQINKYAEATGEEDRTVTHRDGLQVITPQDVAETNPPPH